MKKLFVLIAIMAVTFGLKSCRDQEPTTHTKEVIREVEVKEDESDGILEKAGKKVDDKINEEVDKTLDKID